MKKRVRGLAALLALLLLTACAPKAERVTDEELRALRAEYPYDDRCGTADLRVLESFDDLTGFFLMDCAAVLTLTGDWERRTVTLAPADGAPDGPGLEMTGVLCRARVDQVLCGEDYLEGQDEITLYLGSTQTAGMFSLRDVFVPGSQLVCLLHRDSAKNPFAEDEALYSTAKWAAYYLTPEGAVLSVMSMPGLDECSGLYLDAFAQRLASLPARPDVEGPETE